MIRMRVIIAALAMLAGALTTSAAPASASHSNPCSISGAYVSFFGCGRVLYDGGSNGLVALDDTHTDGKLVEFWIETGNGIWQRVATHGSGSPGYYSFYPGTTWYRGRMCRSTYSYCVTIW